MLVIRIMVLSLQIVLIMQNIELPVNPDKPLDVCSALRNLQQYRGKIISVRGQWNGGYLEGDCKVRTNRIVLNFPSRLSRYPTTTDWKWDEKAVEEATKKYEALNSAGHNVIATFIGRINTLPPDFNGRGFGHLGEDPAELVLNTIKDVVSETGKPVRPPLGNKVIGIDR